MSPVVIEKGKILIPTEEAIKTFKPKEGMVRAKLKEHFPDILWERGVWAVYANALTIKTTNLLFGTEFPIPENSTKMLVGFPFKTKPMKHQLEALISCGGREAFAYFMEPGTGKTKTVIDDMQLLSRDKGLTDVLILCPKSIKKTWLREIEIHGWSDEWEIWVWTNNSKSSGCVKVQDGGNSPTMRWVIMNIDIVNYDRGYIIAKEFLAKAGCSAIIVDESTVIKNIEAARTLRSIELGHMANYRRILSGTPIAHSPLDFYAQLTFLDENIFYGWSFYAFKNHFCVLGGYRKKEILGFINQAELASTVAKHSFQVVKSDCMDLPSRTFQIREVEPSKQFWSTYEAIVEEVILSVDGNLMTTQMIVQKISKLRQLVGGWLLPDWPVDDIGNPIKSGTREAILVDPSKRDELITLLEEYRGFKGIIWCFFQHEVEFLTGILKDEGWNPVSYYGKLSGKQRDYNEDAFERGTADLFIAQIDTGGMGLTLNAASFMIYYNRPVYLLPRTQSLERNYRKGQEKNTTVVDLITPGTIDETNYNSLNSKQDLANLLMKASRDPEVLSDLLIRKTKKSWKGKGGK